MKRMGKYLAGMLLTVFGLFALAPNAGAAEIPPSEECVATAKKLLGEYPDVENFTEEDTRKADRKFVNDLADSGCISDSRPLLQKVVLKPNSEKCVTAARGAGAFWGATTKRFRPLNQRWRKQGRPLQRRINRIQRRIRQLREAGASRERLNQLVRIRRPLGRKLQRIQRDLQREARLIVKPMMHESFLVTSELIALRCMPRNLLGESDPGPAERVVRKNIDVVLFSLAYLTEATGGEVVFNLYFPTVGR